jgi:SAM-dependent methyltransferase
MLKPALRLLNERVMFPRRYAFLTRELSPFLRSGQTLLDVGSSNGRLVRSLTAGLPDVAVAGVDVHVQPGALIPIEKYDGRTLPFDDDSFDCTLLVDVLHHADDPTALLQEATRVSRRHVLIKDHYYVTRLDWHVLKWADRGGNAPHDIVLPFHYFTLPEWKTAIAACGLSVLFEKPFTNYAFDPCKHVIYHLGKDRSAKSW